VTQAYRGCRGGAIGNPAESARSVAGNIDPPARKPWRLRQSPPAGYGTTITAGFEEKLAHAFQKKSKAGIKTPKHELAAIRRGITAAGIDYEERRPNERPATGAQD